MRVEGTSPGITGCIGANESLEGGGGSWSDAEVAAVEVERFEKVDDPEEEREDGRVVKPEASR